MGVGETRDDVRETKALDLTFPMESDYQLSYAVLTTEQFMKDYQGLTADAVRGKEKNLYNNLYNNILRPCLVFL